MTAAFTAAVLVTFLALETCSLSISDIQGISFQSPYAGLFVHDVTGVVAAKDAYGFWLVGEPADDLRASNGIRVYDRNVARLANVGDLVSLSGQVSEYRQPMRRGDLFLTEIERPSNVRVISSGHRLTPIVLGEDRVPPRQGYSALDKGADGWLSVPNNVTLNEAVNATLRPDKYGLDFWESLEGQLVTVKNPVAVGFPDRFGSFWAYGAWSVNGKNSRGGLSLAFDSDSLPYAHSEAVLIGHPLDRTRNPGASMGMTLSDITGVVTYQFGFYTILPLTAASIVAEPDTPVKPAPIHPTQDPCELTIGDYNVENMAPRSQHIPRIADHIANYLNAPDIVFVQEIQDDSGSSNNGVVTANRTLSNLVKALAKAGGGVKYEFVNIPPENNADGGKPGSNIRVAYLWRPEKVSLLAGFQIGNATQATEAIAGKDGKLSLSPNPGRVDPTNPAWEETRKPLAVAWQTTTGERFFTVNVHLSSKRDSSSAHGDARPPVNGHSERRALQVNVTAHFIESILSQEIDHIFVSEAIGRRGTEVEHVHVNTWAPSIRERASDHDPTVAKVRVCDATRSQGNSVNGPKLFVQGSDTEMP